LVYLEAGALGVAVDGRSPASVSHTPGAAAGAAAGDMAVVPGNTATLMPGGLLRLPEGVRIRTRNDNGLPAVLLVVEIQRSGGTGEELAPGTLPDDPALHHVAIETLAGGLKTTFPTGPAVFAIGRVTLLPGARFPAAGAAGPVLLVGESGRLELTTPDGKAWVRRGADGTYELLAGATLAFGDGALIPATTATALRNAGEAPLVVLIVTITVTPRPPEPAMPDA
jgi:hypothetical protein